MTYYVFGEHFKYPRLLLLFFFFTGFQQKTKYKIDIVKTGVA